jgi:hypothetical protein
MMLQCLPLFAADHHNAGAHKTLRTGELLSAISSNSVKQGFLRNATKGSLQKYNQRVSAEMQQKGFPRNATKKGFFRNETKGSLQKCNKRN